MKTLYAVDIVSFEGIPRKALEEIMKKKAILEVLVRSVIGLYEAEKS